MFIINARAVAIAAALGMVSFAGVAEAAAYRTTVSLFEITVPTEGAPERVGPVGTIAVDWTTAKTSGLVTVADLSELVSVYDVSAAHNPTGAAISQFDVMILGGAVQPVGGAARTLDNLLFRFDLDAFAGSASAGAIDFDNDSGGLQTGESGATAGVAYSFATAPIFPFTGWRITPRTNGADDFGITQESDTLLRLAAWEANTVVVSSDVPLPAGALLLPAALAGLVLVRRRKA